MHPSTPTPGDEIKLSAAGTVQVNIQWTATQNLTGTIELVQNGVVVASRQASVSSSAPASLSTSVEFTKSGWLAARRMGSNGHMVHTAAVFVTVDNAPVRASAADADFFVQWMDNLLAKTSSGGAWTSGNNYFTTFIHAYNAAVLSDGVIHGRDFSFGETINLTFNKAITIMGGYDINYLNQSGYSQIMSLTVTNGSVVIDRLTIN